MIFFFFIFYRLLLFFILHPSSPIFICYLYSLHSRCLSFWYIRSFFWCHPFLTYSTNPKLKIGIIKRRTTENKNIENRSEWQNKEKKNKHLAEWTVPHVIIANEAFNSQFLFNKMDKYFNTHPFESWRMIFCFSYFFFSVRPVWTYFRPHAKYGHWRERWHR